jgi:hypothetical protein
MKTILWSTLALLLLTGPVLAQTESGEATESQEEHESEYVRTPPAPYAQWLVDTTVAAHAELSGMEMAVVLDDTCRTIAATDEEDLDELCGGDELGAMKQAEPDLEMPSKDEPEYEVTLALHDAKGGLIGSLGMDLDPADLNSDAALALARKILAEIEAKIPAKDHLFKDAPSAGKK